MAFEALKSRLRASPQTWVVTGVAGFIGSNLLETLLRLDQRVVGLDNFATGKRDHLVPLRGKVDLIEGDIRYLNNVQEAVQGADYVIHLAARALD